MDVLLFQAWLALETAASVEPIGESGCFPVTRSALVKALQALDASGNLVNIREKQLEQIRADLDDETTNDLYPQVEGASIELNAIKARNKKKTVRFNPYKCTY